MMFFLGLLLPICYIPGITSVQVLPQWALLSFILPVILREQILVPKAFFIWFVFGIFSLTLSLHWVTWLFGLWTLAVWGLSFQLGLATNNPIPLFRGLAFGLGVSSIVCIFQWLGYISPATSGGVAGLLFNTGVLSIACGLTIVALGMYKRWWLIFPLLPVLILAHSRAGWFAIVIGAAAKVHWLLPLAVLIACNFLTNSTTDPLRHQIWGITFQCLSLFGHGAGSFIDLFYQLDDDQIVHPEYAHNDYLQLLYEYGAFAIIPFLGLGLGLTWRTSPLVYAAAATALVEPVLYNPISAFILCFALGHALRDFEFSGLILRLRRLGLLPRQRSSDASLVLETLPVHMDTSEHKKVT